MFKAIHKGNQIEVNASFLINQLEECVVIETINRTKEELVKECVKELIKLHLQDVISKIDVESLVKAVYLGTAREISKEIARG